MNEPSSATTTSSSRPALMLADPGDIILTTAEVHERYHLKRTAAYR